MERLRIRWRFDEELPENEYYLTLASRFRLLKFGAILLTVLLLCGLMTVYSDEITVENFRYLLRDFDNRQEVAVGQTVIRFDRASGQKYALYKGDLAILSPGRTALYAPDGRTLVNALNGLNAPMLLSGDKYFLAYEPLQAGTSVLLYNAFSLLHQETFETPIYDAAIADDGTYAIATEATGYKGIVCIYDEEFDLLSTVYGDRYIWDIALRDDGERLLILSASGAGARFTSEVHLVNTGSAETVSRVILEGELVIDCAFTEEGFTVMTDSGLHMYDASGGAHEEISFEGQVPIGWCPGEKGCAVFFNRTVLGSDVTVRVFPQGAGYRETEVEQDILASVAVNDTFLLLTDSTLITYHGITGARAAYPIDHGCLSLLAVDDKTVYLCYDDRAVPLVYAPNTDPEGENND